MLFAFLSDNERPEPKLLRHNHIYYKDSDTNPKYEKGKYECPWGQGICGIDTSGDNDAGKTTAETNESGINEVKIFCCAFPEDMMPDYKKSVRKTSKTEQRMRSPAHSGSSEIDGERIGHAWGR